jgi:type II secretory pathway pseudopilin PulG
MANYRSSRIFPIALVIVIIIIAITALVSVARVVLSSGSTDNTTQVDASREALLDTSADRTVTMTARGPIVANEEFRSYQIDISASNRTIKTYSGYLGKVIDQNALGNNVASYAEFVHALDKADLTKGSQFESDQNDTRGICATGSVYKFEILNADKVVKDLWTSTCKGSSGSLDASVVQLTNLFIAQIPGAESQIGNLRLKQTLSL